VPGHELRPESRQPDAGRARSGLPCCTRGPSLSSCSCSSGSCGRRHVPGGPPRPPGRAGRPWQGRGARRDGGGAGAVAAPPPGSGCCGSSTGSCRRSRRWPAGWLRRGHGAHRGLLPRLGPARGQLGRHGLVVSPGPGRRGQRLDPGGDPIRQKRTAHITIRFSNRTPMTQQRSARTYDFSTGAVLTATDLDNNCHY